MKTGTVYLLHFDDPVAGRQHYVGYTTNLKRRLWQHQNGRGARLTKLVHAAGVEMRLPRTWVGGLELERQIKREGHFARHCALCQRNGAEKNLGQVEPCAS